LATDPAHSNLLALSKPEVAALQIPTAMRSNAHNSVQPAAARCPICVDRLDRVRNTIAPQNAYVKDSATEDIGSPKEAPRPREHLRVTCGRRGAGRRERQENPHVHPGTTCPGSGDVQEQGFREDVLLGLRPSRGNKPSGNPATRPLIPHRAAPNAAPRVRVDSPCPKAGRIGV
jgi:hypothetical protein